MKPENTLQSAVRHLIAEMTFAFDEVPAGVDAWLAMVRTELEKDKSQALRVEAALLLDELCDLELTPEIRARMASVCALLGLDAKNAPTGQQGAGKAIPAH